MVKTIVSATAVFSMLVGSALAQTASGNGSSSGTGHRSVSSAMQGNKGYESQNKSVRNSASDMSNNSKADDGMGASHGQFGSSTSSGVTNGTNN